MRIKPTLLTLLALALVAGASLPLVRNTESLALDEQARSQAPGQFAHLPEGPVHYQLMGPDDGPLVVFVHGFSVPSFTWEKNARHLAERGFRTLTFDLYGRGWSARPAVAYDRATFVTQLADLLGVLGIDGKVSLVGISMGGAVAAAFAADFPERVASQVFLAPFNRPIDIGPLATPLLGDYLAYSFFIPGLAEQQLGDFFDPDHASGWIDRFRRQMDYQGFRRALLATAREFLQSDPMADFRAVGVAGTRSLLLWGDSDATFPYEQSGPVRDALGPRVEFKLIRNAGHALHYEQAGDVNRYLVDFLDRVR
jgi:pimeloyl-ACP methyl ester carboxylesterase